ncbi:winged helix-turn-helix transcriptional regulator [Nocardioides rubriscoriae]|uniref:winged helix-turn-helix transcriptional regulator n=1 Tax=Nocardioides rubriscoriae TaxID=642762 RepID=UPI0011DFCF51|nr:helix-turn-helix domain-containing protein [Nocardioides rubriscoriae]
MSDEPTDVVHLSPRLADRSTWSAESCTMAATMATIGTRGSLMCLRESFYGVRRFEEFVSRVGLSEAVVAARLKDLVAAGLLERRPYREPGQRVRDEYVLTEAGHDLLPALVSLMQWGDRWLTPDGRGPIALRHHGSCGETVRAELRCGAGHQVVASDVEASPGVRARPRA